MRSRKVPTGCIDAEPGVRGHPSVALQRARETLDKQRVQPAVHLPTDRAQRRLLDRYVFAWENDDIEALVSVLRDDAVYSMPPWPRWYAGSAAIAAFHQRVWSDYAGQRLLSIGANCQPAFAMYAREYPDEPFRSHSIQLLGALSQHLWQGELPKDAGIGEPCNGRDVAARDGQHK